MGVVSREATSQGGGAMETACNIANAINQYNPVANLWDVISYAFTNKDRFGNPISLTQANLKALAVVPIPIGKIGSLGASTIEGFTEHGLNQIISRGFTAPDILTIMREGVAEDVMGRYGMQTRFTLGENTLIINKSGKIITAFSSAADGVFIPFK